jgi:hypothetical protein
VVCYFELHTNGHAEYADTSASTPAARALCVGIEGHAYRVRCTMDTQSMLDVSAVPGSSPEAPVGTKSTSTVRAVPDIAEYADGSFSTRQSRSTMDTQSMST